MGTKRKLVAILVVICMLATMFPSVPITEYEASEKIGSELLELMNVTYDDLTSGNFVDSGETYSCIIWIEDVEIEEAVEAGIDAAEMTREDYSTWSMYDYPYTTDEADGLTYVDVEFDETESDEYVQTYIEAEREAAAEMYSASNSSFVAENFMARDMSVTYVSKYSPCVFADLSVTKIAELMENDEVVCIGYSGDEHAVLDSVNSSSTLDAEEVAENITIIRADYASDYFAVTGDGIKIGQIEHQFPDTNTVIKNHEDQNVIGFEAHADNVHHIMSAVAPDATYYSTALEDSEGNFYEQIEWLLGQGVNIINMCMGYEKDMNGNDAYNTYDMRARWVDHIAYNHDVHFVKSAGNYVLKGVNSPGMAYNIITVGAVGTTGTCDIINRYENGAYVGSAYNRLGVSLAEGRTNKPDVMAPGEYTDDWGTSYAAPLVAGTIALMCEYQPSLKTQQHIVKAILAATTAKVTNNHHHVTTDVYFSSYGAGVIDTHSAMYAVYKRHYSTSTDSLTNVGDKKTYSMTVTSSDTCMRIAVAHANRNKIVDGADHVTAHLPLYTIGVIGIKVYNPDGELILNTYDQDYITGINLQVVEFDPRENGGAGTYTIEVILKQAAQHGRTTNFGIAWR